MKAYRRSGVVAPFIFNLGTRRSYVFNFTSSRFTPWKEQQYKLNRRLGGPKYPIWKF
jgi:hypothetical protein